MKRWIFLFLLSMIMMPPLVYSIVIPQNLTFKDAVISDGGTYLLTGNNIVIKLNEGMNVGWMVRISDDFSLHRLVPAKDGVLLVGGLLVRLNENGSILWAKNLSTEHVTVLPNGGIAFAEGNLVGLLDSNGNPLWALRLEVNHSDSLPNSGIHVTTLASTENVIIMAGTADVPDDPKSHLFIGAISLNGTLLWTKVFDTGYYDRPDVGTSLGESGLVAGVYGGGSDAPWIASYFVMKVSPDGKIEWFNSCLCPRRESWDAFWSMKVLGMTCNDNTCAVGTTTGIFILETKGDPKEYFNVTGKPLRIPNGSILLLSNGTLLTVNSHNGSEGKCYVAKAELKRIAATLTPEKVGLKVSNVKVEPAIKRHVAEDDAKPDRRGKNRESMLNVAFSAVILAGIALVIGVLRNSRR